MIFVTGGTGLIGRFILEKLVGEGKPVRALKRKNSINFISPKLSRQIEWIDGDISDVCCLMKAMESVHTVIHSAGLVSYAPSDRAILYKVNVEGTSNVVNAALQAGSVSSFIHISSVAALTKNKYASVVSEDENISDAGFTSEYGKSKYFAELEVYRGMEEGLNAISLNPTIVLGPGDWNKGSSHLFKYVYEKKPFYTDGRMNFIDVRDVAEIVFRMMEYAKTTNGEKFILSTGEISYYDFFSKVAKHFKVKGPSIKATPFLSEIAWRTEALKSIFSGKKPLITRETVRLTQAGYSYDNSKIRNLLNFTFRSLEETIPYTCSELLNRYVEKKTFC